jgi:hypothetical protein
MLKHRSVLFLCLLVALCASPLLADDNTIDLKGDVFYMDVIKSNGVYLETLLWVWSDSPTQTLQSIAVRCNGNGGGSLANCLYASSFFACATSTQSWSDFYEPTLTTVRTSCGVGARRDAGECVRFTAKVRPLDSFVYSVFANGHPKSVQALSLDVTDINFESVCAVKP